MSSHIKPCHIIEHNIILIASNFMLDIILPILIFSGIILCHITSYSITLDDIRSPQNCIMFCPCMPDNKSYFKVEITSWLKLTDSL